MRTRRVKHPEGGEEWACYADMYLLTSVIFLMLYFISQSQLDKSNSELLKSQETILFFEKEMQKLHTTHEQTLAKLDQQKQMVQVQKNEINVMKKTIQEEKAYSQEVLGQISQKDNTIQDMKKELLTQKMFYLDVQRKLQNEKTHSQQIMQQLVKQEELRKQETVFRRELLGVEGELQRVVFIFDRSGSMKRRWDVTQSILRKWLDYLPVKECVLLTFNESVTYYSDNPFSPFVNLGGQEGKDNKVKMIQWLKDIVPEGETNTYAALQKAFSYDGIDTICLFTDGAPTAGKSKTEIEKLCRENFMNKGIRVNTIALGGYNQDSSFTEFLQKIAKVTNGSYRGR